MRQIAKATTAQAAGVEYATAGALGKIAGYGLTGIGFVLGVGMEGYTTHKFCEETLDKFVEYYKKNANKIKNSYQEAAEYFFNNNSNF